MCVVYGDDIFYMFVVDKKQCCMMCGEIVVYDELCIGWQIVQDLQVYVVLIGLELWNFCVWCVYVEYGFCCCDCLVLCVGL